MKTLPILLAAGVVAAAALAPHASPRVADDHASRFVACADRLGALACEFHLDEWEKEPGARRQIIERFARDKAFALHLMALEDARIVTGSVRTAEPAFPD